MGSRWKKTLHSVQATDEQGWIDAVEACGRSADHSPSSASIPPDPTETCIRLLADWMVNFDAFCMMV